jgi:hypothetical protein
MMNTLAIVSDLNEGAADRRCQPASLPNPSMGLNLSQLRQWLAAGLSGYGVTRRLGIWGVVLSLILGLFSCSSSVSVQPRKITLAQSWELESGDRIGGYLVTGSLGDISVQLGRRRLLAPYTGKVEPAAQGANCIYFSTPDIPAYLFRFCGIGHPRVGVVEAGDVIGRGRLIHFATMRLQPDGAWAIVEPSDQVLEKSLPPPSGRFF